MKFISRKQFETWLDAQKPRSKPCNDGLCPIAAAMDGRISSSQVITLGPKWADQFARAIDRYCMSRPILSRRYRDLTTAQIRSVYDATFHKQQSLGRRGR